MAAPQSLADHDDAIGSRLVFRSYESTPRKRRNPHRRKQVRRGERCSQAFGIATAGQVHVHRPENREVLEYSILRAPIDEVRPGYRNHIEAGCSDRAFANDDEAVDIRVWQRTQQHAVEYAEDRGGGANAQRQRDDDDRRESGVFGQRSQGVAGILPNRSDHRHRSMMFDQRGRSRCHRLELSCEMFDLPRRVAPRRRV